MTIKFQFSNWIKFMCFFVKCSLYLFFAYGRWDVDCVDVHAQIFVMETKLKNFIKRWKCFGLSAFVWDWEAASVLLELVHLLMQFTAWLGFLLFFSKLILLEFRSSIPVARFWDRQGIKLVLVVQKILFKPPHSPRGLKPLFKL